LCAVLVVSLLAGGRPYLLVGASDPGSIVAVTTPVVRLLADISAAMCLGSLAFGVCCTRPQSSGLVSPIAYRELHVAAVSGAVWAGCALLMVPLSAADVGGQQLTEVLPPQHLVALVEAAEPPRAWLLSALVATVVAVGARLTLRWQPL